MLNSCLRCARLFPSHHRSILSVANASTSAIIQSTNSQRRILNRESVQKFVYPSPSSECCVRGAKVRRQRSKKDKDLPNFIRDVRKRGQKQEILLKDDRPRVNVWRNMTVAELAGSSEISVDDVFEVIIRAELDEVYDQPESALPLDVLDRLCRLMNVKMIFRDEPVPLKSAIEKEVSPVEEEPDLDVYARPPPDPAKCVPRAPVVTIMGHVDHGKTTLLDSLRNSQIVDQEFGGITQHIGAFKVKLPKSGKTITFLDTPGHAAFHAIRQRGAKATDLVVLVVAADDGVMQQTIESIRFAQASCVPIVVAINKCDRYNIDIEATKQTLSEYGVVAKELGGDVTMVPISALKRTNLDALQSAIVDKATELKLVGEADGLTEGVVIESKTDPHLGKICTVLVQRGTMKIGQYLVAGRSWCRVGLSGFAEVTGWKEDIAEPGAVVLQVDAEKRAKQAVAYRQKIHMQLKSEEAMAALEADRELHQQLHNEKRREKIESRVGNMRFGWTPRAANPAETVHSVDPDKPRLQIIVKTDVEGSLEALMQVLDTYDSDKCALRVVDFGVGPPSQLELDMAKEFDAEIYFFNVPQIPKAASEFIQQNSIPVKHFNVIYHLIDDLKQTLSDKLPMVEKIEPIGEGSVLKEFQLRTGRSGKLSVAGTKVERGSFDRAMRFRVERGGIAVFDGTLESMKNERESVDQASVLDEVGLMFDGITPEVRFEPGDKVICYRSIAVPQPIDWSPPGF